MLLGSEIRKLLHTYGVHSVTIQPEFFDEKLDEKVPYLLEHEDAKKSNKEGIENASTSLHALSDAQQETSNEVK